MPTIEAEPFEVRQLSSAQMVEIAALTTQGLMLFFLSVAWQPLVFAELTGMRVLGAELPIRLTPKTTAMHLMERWAALAWGAAAPATTRAWLLPLGSCRCGCERRCGQEGKAARQKVGCG